MALFSRDDCGLIARRFVVETSNTMRGQLTVESIGGEGQVIRVSRRELKREDAETR